MPVKPCGNPPTPLAKPAVITGKKVGAVPRPVRPVPNVPSRRNSYLLTLQPYIK